MHKTTAAAAGARRVRALSSSQKHVLFPLLHSAGLPWAAVVLHDVGSWLARAGLPKAARGRAARFGHTRPKTSRSAGRHYQWARPKEGRARDRRLLSKNWPCKAGTYNGTIRTALKAAITIYVLQGGYKEDFLTALAHIKQKQN